MCKQENNTKFQFLKNKKVIIISIIIAVVLILTIIFCTIFSLINMNSTKMIQGVKINNTDIAGLTRQEATQKMQEEINKKNTSKIKLVKDEFNSEISIEQLEVNYNIENAIEEAFLVGRSGNIFSNNFEILGSKTKGRNIELNIEYNSEKLNQIIDEINGGIPGAIKDNSYYIEESNLIITKGTDGKSINREELSNKVKENIAKLSVLDEQIDLPVEDTKVKAIDIEKIYNEIHTEAKDAYYTKDPFTVYPHVTGVDFAISLDEAKNMLQEEKQEYVIPLKITVPNITTDKIGSEAFPDMLSTFTTRYDGGNVDRTTNLRKAVNKINGMVIMPGQTFSYNATLGQRSIAAGYREAKVYQGGKVIDGIGGGICQISSTLYNSVVFANLEIVARRNHGFVPSYLGAGRDATVVYGATDFKFKNTRKYPIKIVASVKNGIARVDIYGIKEETEYKIDIQTSITETIPFKTTYIDDPSLPVGKEVVEQKGQNGCKSVAYKVMSLNGKVVSRTLLSSDTYNAMEKLIRRGVENTSVVPQPEVTPDVPTVTPETVPEQTPTQEVNP